LEVIEVKAILKTIDDHGCIYSALMFCCPGCAAAGPEGYDGIHMLPVNSADTNGKPCWEWNGDLEKPTLSPSILSRGGSSNKVCHSFLKDGIFEFLTDSEHPLSGQKVPIPDLPSWTTEE